MAKENIFNVTTCYNEDKFMQMLSKHSEHHRKGTQLSKEFVIQCIAALLACHENNKVSKEIYKMEALLANLGIKFTDARSSKPKVLKANTYSYIGEPEVLTGDPEYAVKTFNELMSTVMCCNPI